MLKVTLISFVQLLALLYLTLGYGGAISVQKKLAQMIKYNVDKVPFNEFNMYFIYLMHIMIVSYKNLWFGFHTKSI